MTDVTRIPVGMEISGDIINHLCTTYNGDRMVHSNRTVFQPHDGIVTLQQSRDWSKEHYIKHVGSDEHYYSDVEFVTYKDPKTGTERTDKCYGISIQREVNVIVYRRNGKRSTMSIPIANVISKKLYDWAKPWKKTN